MMKLYYGTYCLQKRRRAVRISLTARPTQSTYARSLPMQADFSRTMISTDGWHMEMVRFAFVSSRPSRTLSDIFLLKAYSSQLYLQYLTSAESKHPQADASYMQRREFCFTLDGDIFVRYQSFKVRVRYTIVNFSSVDCFLLTSCSGLNLALRPLLLLLARIRIHYP